jgi:hypothetical protein
MTPAALTKVRSGIMLLGICAATALALPAAQASAQDNNPDPGVRCAAKIGPGEYEFYLPGAKVTDVNGVRWVCGPDGQWFRDYTRVSVPTASSGLGNITGVKSTNISNRLASNAQTSLLQSAP